MIFLSQAINLCIIPSLGARASTAALGGEIDYYFKTYFFLFLKKLVDEDLRLFAIESALFFLKSPTKSQGFPPLHLFL